MNINRLLFQKMDENTTNSTYNGIITTSYHNSHSFINNISVVVNIGGLQSTPGAAHFLEHMKFWYNNTNLYDTMNKLQTVLNATTSEFTTDFSLCCTKNQITISINHLLKSLYNHTFSIDIFEKEKKVIINEIKGYDLLISDKEQLNFIRKIIGRIPEVKSLTIEELSKLSIKNYQKNNTHIYIYGDMSIDNEESTSNNYNNGVLHIPIKFIDKECTISGKNIEIIIKVLYLTFCGDFNFTYHGRYIKTNQAYRKLSKIHFDNDDYLIFKNNSFKRVVDLLEDPNSALRFLEFFKIQKGDFSRFYDCMSNSLKLETLLDNLITEVN
ncbi:insulinase family protein [Lysinibacillus sp. NPDC056959]|uniref:insulinase family protein n=1 Tax=Lysinibacillus sp. NPDC056959 TaxID=3345981 RepID=UPI00363F5E53